MLKFDTPWQSRIHRPWAEARLRTIAGLYEATRDADPFTITEGQQRANKLREKIIECGRFSCVYQDEDTGEIVLSSARCKSRICPRCGCFRGRYLKSSIEEAIKEIDAPKFITLTPEHTNEPLRVQVKKLRHDFANLRRQKLWKAKVRGGVAVVEVKWSMRSNQWHPHLHILCDADYWNKQSISDAWRIASGGAYVVDVKAIHQRSKYAHYLTKYVTKTGENGDIPFNKIAEHAIGVHGLRLVSTFGTLHGKIRESPPKLGGRELGHVAHLGPVAEAQESGDLRADRCLRAVLLAARLQRADDAERLSTRDEHRSRKAALKLWAWREKRDNHDDHETADRPAPIPRSRGSGDGALGLWQEPDVTANALEHGR